VTFCRIIYNTGDLSIKFFINGDGYTVPASEDNLSRLLILAGTHYPGSAVWEGDGIETPILPPGKRCKCGAVVTAGMEKEHRKECGK
jgi:hypothetical protein